MNLNNYEMDIPELHLGAMRHNEIVSETKQVQELSYDYIESNFEDGKLEITAGFSVDCLYSIELSFKNFSFTIFTVERNELKIAIMKLEKLLINKKLKEHVINYKEHETEENKSESWKFNFNTCVSDIVF